MGFILFELIMDKANISNCQIVNFQPVCYVTTRTCLLFSTENRFNVLIVDIKPSIISWIHNEFFSFSFIPAHVLISSNTKAKNLFKTGKYTPN